MPPTIQVAGREDRSSRDVGEKRSDIVCRVKYNNSLPDIPFDAKFITYPFESLRFIQYKTTTLERMYKHELLTEHDLGVIIDLINPDTYSGDNGVLDIDDEKLLEEDSAIPQDPKRSRHSKSVSWLRKTEYISTENNRFQLSSDKAESRIGYNIKKQLKDEEFYRDKESQIKAIEDTFEAAKQPITKHYSKPGVEPMEVLPVYPDFMMWRFPCAQVMFDSDPAPKNRSVPVQLEEMSQAMIRGMTDESGDQFVAYFLPTEETLKKRKRDVDEGVSFVDGDEYDYFLAREYNWNVKNKSTSGYEENYFFVLRDDGMYYNELETRVRLSKRRKLGAAAPNSNSRLAVKHRELNEVEIEAHERRLMSLEPTVEEEDAEEQQEQAEDEAQAEDEKDAEDGQNDNNDEEIGEKSGSEDEKKEESDDENTNKEKLTNGEEKENEEKDKNESGDEENDKAEESGDEEKDKEDIFGGSSEED